MLVSLLVLSSLLIHYQQIDQNLIEIMRLPQPPRRSSGCFAFSDLLRPPEHPLLAHSFRTETDREGHVWTAPRGHVWTAPRASCLDGAPSSRVWLRLCERIGCGHVFGLLARETNIPLALMLVRMALRPISKTRSLWRLPFSSGFRAVPLVHIASPSPSMRIALRRNLVPAEPAGFRPRPDGRRNGRLWSRAHRRSAPACWRAPPRSA